MYAVHPLLTIFCRADNNSVNQQIFKHLVCSHSAVSHFKSATAEWQNPNSNNIYRITQLFAAREYFVNPIIKHISHDAF